MKINEKFINSTKNYMQNFYTQIKKIIDKSIKNKKFLKKKIFRC